VEILGGRAEVGGNGLKIQSLSVRSSSTGVKKNLLDLSYYARRGRRV
jgi:hypothetical protein